MYPDISAYGVKEVTLNLNGRPSYLSETSMEDLKLYSLALDFNGYPISKATVREAIMKLKKREENLDDLEPPSKPTVRKIINTLHIPVISLRKGVSVEKLKQMSDTLGIILTNSMTYSKSIRSQIVISLIVMKWGSKWKI